MAAEALFPEVLRQIQIDALASTNLMDISPDAGEFTFRILIGSVLLDAGNAPICPYVFVILISEHLFLIAGG
jgi:hypothetical protein